MFIKNLYIILILIVITSFETVTLQDASDINGNQGDCLESKDCSTKEGKKTASIAQHAALEAKAAQQAQVMAAAQAAQQVKEQLAEKAQEAAKTAEAAYLGKKEMVEQLQKLIRDTQRVIDEESKNLLILRQLMETAMRCSHEAQALLKLLQQTLKIAQANSAHSAEASKGAECEIKEKERLVKAAKCKLDQLIAELQIAKAELAITKVAADKAMACAKLAKKFAMQSCKRNS